MLDRAFAKVFANLSTLVLLASVFTMPLFIGHALFFRNELALRDIAPEIRELPEGRQVRGVAASDMDAQRVWLLVIAGVSLLTVPLVYRGAHRVHDLEEAGGVPTVPDALAHLASPAPRVALTVPAVAGASGVASIAAFLTWRIVDAAAGFAPDGASWILIAVGRGVAAGVFVALVAGTIAALPAAAPVAAPVPTEKLELY
ncbi:MAG TPA: hypothetical protein VG929_02745 [Actinomycetota bacterium]|nr:hypothetical protein [Actinomycetota bacterium]